MSDSEQDALRLFAHKIDVYESPPTAGMTVSVLLKGLVQPSALQSVGFEAIHSYLKGHFEQVTVSLSALSMDLHSAAKDELTSLEECERGLLKAIAQKDRQLRALEARNKELVARNKALVGLRRLAR